MYVNEAHETLTLCLDESTELDDKIQGVYDRYRASLEILAQDPLGLAKAKYANSWQRSYIMEDLVSEFIRVRTKMTLSMMAGYMIANHHRLLLLLLLGCCVSTQGFAVVLIIICITLYCFLWKTPFNIHNIEFLFYFIPYYVSAALPTAIAMNWKLIQPDPVSQTRPPYHQSRCSRAFERILQRVFLLLYAYVCMIYRLSVLCKWPSL